MLDALRVVRFSLVDFWEEFVLLISLNLLWSLAVLLPVSPWLLFASAPSVWIVPLSLLLALPLPIVTAGLCFVTNQVTRAKAVSGQTFATGVRRYWRKALGVTAINVVALLLIASNLRFYAVVVEGTWTSLALGIWLVLACYWLLVQIYWFPIILEMENDRVLLGLRNALVLVIVSPGFSVVTGLLMLVLLVVGTLLTVPAILILASLLLLMSNHATRSRLARVRKETYRPGPDED
ncbi:MAG TPA: hypothetical protein VLC52_09885 [Anaerolineae bacterium]|nr:hypothetical protein [Anaerolineae bacterium]